MLALWLEDADLSLHHLPVPTPPENEALIYERYPLGRALEAFSKAAEPGALKVLLDVETE